MKNIKKLILIVMVFAFVFTACGFIFGSKEKIGKDAALEIALKDAKLTLEQVSDIDIELERSLFHSARYEIDFESGRTEYEYKINAYTGKIISARTD